ncbi:MAG: N-acetylmuramoyl-L-alanine amidase [Clostridium sp.]
MIKVAAVRGGHNTKVRGAKGYVDEVDEDRLIYREVVRLLKLEGITVFDVTPGETNTKYQDLSYGVSLANKHKADVFISCHINSSNGKGNGCEVIYCPGSTKGAIYATQISESISKLGFKNRGAKVDSRGLYELRHSAMPTVIIEPFFLDNRTDVDTYKKVGPLKIAKAIVEGLLLRDIKENIQGDDVDMVPSVKLAACKDSKIKSSMINYIKALQSCMRMEQTGVATHELCMKLPMFNGGEEKGTASILQDILIVKGYLSTSKDRPALGNAVKDAIKSFRADNGIPQINRLTDPLTWMKLIEY